MPIEVTVPELGESVVEGEIGTWHVGVGEDIEMDEPLVTIETDKIEMEMPSPATGTLVERFEDDGTVVEVGQLIGVIALPDEDYEKGSITPESGGHEASSSPIDTSYMDEEEESEEEPEPAAASTDGAEGGEEDDDDLGGYAATTTGDVQEVSFHDQTPGEEAGEEVATAEPEPAPEPKPATGAEGDGDQSKANYLSPAVQRLVSEHDLDPNKIEGTGRGGRIRKVDIDQILESGEVEKYKAGAPEPATTEKPEREAAAPSKEQALPETVGEQVEGKHGPEERIETTRIRKTIANQMSKSKNTAAHTYDIQQADVTKLVELRERHKEDFQERYGVKLSYMAFFTKAVVAALKEFPNFNASLSEDHEEVIRKQYYNVGMAVNTDAGLMVPNIKDADSKNMVDICREITDLAERARSRDLKLNELEGGTFTLTNAGGHGTLISAPVINYPEVGILGIHEIDKRPVVNDDGEIVARDTVYLTLGFDHRIIDGVYAVEFLGYIIDQLEDPEWMLLQI